MTEQPDTTSPLEAELHALRARVREFEKEEQRLLDAGHLGDERFRRLVQRAPLGLCFVRDDGRIAYVNDRFVRVFGYTLRDVPTLDAWWELAYPDERYRGWVLETWDAAVRRAAEDGVDIQPIEYDVTCSNGTERIIEIGGIVLPDGFLATFIDVTERRHAERDLRAANARLLRSNQDLEQFAYVASHDLQEPLRMVASYTRLLAEAYTGKLDETADRYIGFAIEGTTRMHRLLDDLLEFSRLDSQAMAFAPTPCDAVLEEVLHDLQERIAESGATVRVGPLPTVLADRIQLGRIFQNLISNAIKFRNEAAPVVEISAHRDGAWWEFDVQDNGIGIAPMFHDRIFTIFQRLNTRDEYPGTGIGLAIVKRIVERHGGTIRVHSALGGGARFTVSLPVVSNDIR
jgi:PAS domain S-box-containing protein